MKVDKETILNSKPRLLFLVTEDWYFCSHRLPLAQAAIEAGYDVVVVTRVREHAEAIRSAGIQLIPFEISRHGINPVTELLALIRLARIYLRQRPQIVHHVALKPIVLGSMAARLAGVPYKVNAVTGLGYVFTSKQTKARLLRPLMKRMLKFCMTQPGSHAIFQNPEDQDDVLKMGMGNISSTLVRGAGVDPVTFRERAESAGVPVVVLAARMLRDKGVADFVDAIKILKKRGIQFRAVLAGKPDDGSPDSIPERQLLEWHDSGVVEWWGHVTDMPGILAASHIVCLPSTDREGIPKVLLEAAASGRPIVTSDIPGCREIVRHEVNGLLVPPRNAPALADALMRLIEAPALRKEFGHAGRKLVEAGFSLQRVHSAILNVYQECLTGNPPAGTKPAQPTVQIRD